MAERFGSSKLKNAALGFLAAGSVVTAMPAYADPPGFPAQSSAPRVMGVRFVARAKDFNFFSKDSEAGLFIGKGVTGGARVSDFVGAARNLSADNLVPAVLAATGHSASRTNKFMEVNLTPKSLYAWSDDLNRGNPQEPRAVSIPSLAKMPIPDQLTTMDKYPKEWRLNSTVAADAPPAPQSHLKFVTKVNTANVGVLDNLRGLALH